jgi:hypothetical protein
MAKQYEATNLRTFEAALKKFEIKVKKSVAGVLQQAAVGCYGKILEDSPCKTGSYIASHRIAVNVVDGSDTVYSKKNAIPEGVAKAQAKTQLMNLKGLKETDTVYISNSVGFSNPNHYSWAANVEYTGWTGKGGYLVYEKALMYTISNIAKYASFIKSKGDKILDPLDVI